MAAPLVLMHAYPSTYAYRFDYVCLRCHLLMHICFCLWFLMFAYDIYARLCMFIYLLMGYDVSEGKFCWNYAVWRKGKWLVGILVLKLDKGICEYKGTCPPTVLSFFLSSSRNVLYFYSIQLRLSLSLIPSLPTSVQPSQASCPCPALPSLPSQVHALALPRVPWTLIPLPVRLLHYVASLSSTELAPCPSQLPSPTLLSS
jgi:hypothetical protein